MSIIEHFSENIGYYDNRYCVKLPFKEIKEAIPDNFISAKNRLQYLKKCLDQNPDFLNTCDEIIKDYLTQGIAEKVPRLSEQKDPRTVHYLPHQAVIKKDRDKTKLRIVFDAAFKTKNYLSLSDSLLTGACLLPLLNDILIRFRIGKYGLVADIKQAFLKICLNEEHRDFVRFLGLTNIYAINPEVAILRFARVVFVLSSNPFLLNATIKHHLEIYLNLAEFTEIIQKLILNL